MKGWGGGGEQEGGGLGGGYREGSQQLPLWLNLKYTFCEERDQGFLIPLISSGAEELKPWKLPAPSKPPVSAGSERRRPKHPLKYPLPHLSLSWKSDPMC